MSATSRFGGPATLIGSPPASSTYGVTVFIPRRTGKTRLLADADKGGASSRAIMTTRSLLMAAVAAVDLVEVYGSGDTAVCELGGVVAEFRRPRRMCALWSGTCDSAASVDAGIVMLRICTIGADLSARCVRTVLRKILSGAGRPGRRFADPSVLGQALRHR